MRSNGTRDKTLPTYSLNESSAINGTTFEIIESRGDFRKRKANFLVPHRKDYYLFVLVKKGGSRHWVDFVPYTIKPNTFYFSIPQHVQMKEKSEPLHGFLLSFTEEFLNLEENKFLKQLPIIQNPDNQHELQLTSPDIKFIEDVMRKMLAEFRTTHDWHNAMLLSWLRVLLIYTSRLYSEQFSNKTSSERKILTKFMGLIDEHFSRHHQVSDYASFFKITAGHLSDIIKEQSGKTATELIHERIMLEAKRHLLHTEWSMKEIAFSLGFEDAAYFGRFFKRIEGATPATYRTDIRKKYQ
jgi:AraC family transcriptional activator of pobA